MPDLTDKQRTALAEHLRRAKDDYDFDPGVRLDELAIQYREEARPGRGHDIVYAYVSPDHAFTGGLDPYGYGYMVMADIDIVHNDSDEECECVPCSAAL